MLRRLGLLAAVCALLPGSAAASVGQESQFQDDNTLIFNTTQGTTAALDTLARLGVDRIRVSVFWATVAPDAKAEARPAFDATDPAAYPQGSWDRYDQVVRLATARGIAVNFNITSPAPLWATGDGAPRPDIANTYEPDPAQFGQFVRAVGTRYSGTYRATVLTPQEPSGLCETFQDCPGPVPVPTGEPLPRVAYWSIWNEPNQGGWLTPQWVAAPDGRGVVEASPRLYRGLVDAAWGALQGSDHGKDTILVGETAPKGIARRDATSAMKALTFVRALYCVDAAFKPLVGTPARVRGCPEDPAAFPAEHPALFASSGWAHHPYELATAPDVKPKDPEFLTIANLPRLTAALRRIHLAYRKGGTAPPLFLTEFGYTTNPPNPAGVSLARQAAYLDHAEFLARENPSVRTLTQFLLFDDAPRPGRNGVTAGYGATSQTGLRFLDGRDKPSLTAYELALHLPATRVRRGRALRVWGLVRPTRRIGKAQRVAVELRSGGRTRTLRTLTSRAGGVVDARVRIPASGSLRLAWRDPRAGGGRVVSRAVAVRATRR